MRAAPTRCPSRRSHRPILGRPPERRSRTAELPLHLFHRVLHGPRPADAPQSRALRGRPLGRRRRGVTARSDRPYQDLDGRPPSPPMGGAAPFERSGTLETTGRGRVVPPQRRTPQPCDRGASEDRGRRAPHQQGERLCLQSPRRGQFRSQPRRSAGDMDHSRRG